MLLAWCVCGDEVVTEIGNCQGLPLGDVVDERCRNTTQVNLNTGQREVQDKLSGQI